MTTLNAYLPPSRKGKQIEHDEFVLAILEEFKKVYAGPGKEMITREVDEDEVKGEKVLAGMEELRSWDWEYGGSPEFSNHFEGSVGSDKIVSRPPALL